MNFSVLCDFLDNLRSTKGIGEKTNKLKNFWDNARAKKLEIFPILRLIVPKLDRDRSSYRIKESKISKLIIKMLGLSPGNDKNTLSKSVIGSSIDFSKVIYSILKKYVVNKDIGFSVHDLNVFLDQIANRTTDSGLDDLFLNIIRKLSANSIKCLIQIILKDLKLGISDKTVLKCFHEDAVTFYNTNNSLKRVAQELIDPQFKLHQLEIGIFEPFRPMLSKRIDAQNFTKNFPNGETFFVENKFDGERFQIHMDGDHFKYFSRNGFDFTNNFGSTINQGTFTPLLQQVFAKQVKRFILDGEMMLWNTKTSNFGSKGMKLDVKKLSQGGKYQACFCIYDILLINDEILTNQPLIKRLQVLREILNSPRPGTIVLSEYSEVHSKQEIIDALNASVDRNEEGIIVKNPKSVYKCNDRTSGWFKLKMEYFDDAVHDLDVIMMGGSYGGTGRINSFIVGLKSATSYLTLGRISSGLNTEQLDILNEKLQMQGIDFGKFAEESQGLLLFGRDTPDIYIEPPNSCILTIRATELIRTTNDHVKCPYTLRFPRVVQLRHDKPYDECLTMNELLELTNQNKSVIKLNKRHIELNEISTKIRRTKKIKLDMVNLPRRGKIGEFLKGKRFHVHSTPEKWPIDEIYNSIKLAGGEVIYRPDPSVDIVLITKFDSTIHKLIKNCDIIHTDWLKRVLEAKQLLDYNLEEIHTLGWRFSRNFPTNLDKFGDDFYNKTTQQSLKLSFKLMENGGDCLNVNSPHSDCQIFSKYVAYFDVYEIVNCPDSKQIYYAFPDQMEFQYYGGKVAEIIGPAVNLIIVQDCTGGRILTIRNFIGIEHNVNIVSMQFLKEQISKR